MTEQSVGDSDLPIAGTMPRLRADWRGEYISAATEAERVDKEKGMRAEDGERCVFCRILSAEPTPESDQSLNRLAGRKGRFGGTRSGAEMEPVSTDESNYIVHRGKHCIVILNAYPYTSGHCMVMPVRHVGTLVDLNADEATELWSLVTHASAALGSAYAPEGINVGANLGRAAGAGIPGHLHVHLVPRWNGDTNFMTAIAETRVVPESLASSWRKLRAAW
jgi:ATP adenylyltransferase